MTRPFALALLLVGCSVDLPPELDDGFYACVDSSDCAPDFACAEGNVYSVDFCRPACDRDDPSTCPEGVCTAAGACLDRCTIGEDGSTSTCPGEEFTCVRTDAIRDEGVCYPVAGCSRTADCPTDGDVPQLCLNDALGLPPTSMTLRFDNLYCTGAPDSEDRCPTGYLSFRVNELSGRTRVVCYPPCVFDEEGVPGSPYCPPSMTCFRGVGDLVGLPDTPPCVPGIWGLPCADDTQCLVGTCLPVGDGRRACTETCARAEENQGGCSGLESLGASFGAATRMTCESVGGEDVCVPRYDLFSLCDHQLDCVADVECTLVGPPTQRARICLRACATAEDCAEGTGGTADDYSCTDGFCRRKMRVGQRCANDDDCRTGHCCVLGGGLSACLESCP